MTFSYERPTASWAHRQDERLLGFEVGVGLDSRARTCPDGAPTSDSDLKAYMLIVTVSMGAGIPQRAAKTGHF